MNYWGKDDDESSDYSLIDQRTLVKEGLSMELDFNQRWEPIPIGWFNKWKKYVDFDSVEEVDNRPKEDMENLHPGKIDSTCLKGDFGDELRRDISCDVDFVLLPVDTVNKLFTHYKSPSKVRFPRVTKNCGTEFQPKYYVKLYPTRVEISLYDTETKEITFSGKYYYNINDSSSVKKYRDFLDREQENGVYVFVNYLEKFRIWSRVKVSNDVQADSLNEDGLRYVTMDDVCTINGWKLLLNDEMNVEHLMTEKNCVELMIEKMQVSHYHCDPQWEDWPRYSDLCVWQDQLRANDVIDVRRRLKNKKWQWLEAVVKSTDAEGPMYTTGPSMLVKMS